MAQPKENRQTANKLLRDFEKALGGYKGTCLFVTGESGTYCGQPVTNNCHIVSESAVLHGLRGNKSKKVLELQWGVRQWRELLFRDDREQRMRDTTTFTPPERATHDACVSWFACQQHAHDNEFQPIDVAELDFEDPAVRFLAGYRMSLYLADQYRQASKLIQQWDRIAMRSSNRHGRTLWVRKKNEVKEERQKAAQIVALLGNNWYARKTGGTIDLAVLSARVLTFRSQLRLAGGVSYGKATAVSVFAIQGDRLEMAVFYLTSESGLAKEDIKRLAKVSRASEQLDDYSVTVIRELMSNGWGSLALSPESYEELSDGERSIIQTLVARHSLDAEFVQANFRQPSSRGRRRR